MTLFLDIETTGVSSEDKICSCGLIESNTQHYELYNEGKKITPKASSIHHITNEMIADKGRFQEGEIFALLQKYNTQETTLVVHNAKFIIDMLSSHGFFFEGIIIDTKRVAKHLIKECESYALDFLWYECKLYKEQPYEVNCHSRDDVVKLSLLYEYLAELVPQDTLAQLSVSPVLLEKFSFGKYNNCYIEEISMRDRGYLQWLISLEDIDEDLAYSLQYYLKA